MEPITATSLDDLAEVVVKVEIARPDKSIILVPMRSLPESEIFALRQSIKWPTPPPGEFKKSGPVLNYQDEGYQTAMGEANRKLQYLVFLHGLQLSIPGETDEEKLTTLESRLGNYAYMQLIRASNRLNIVTEEDFAALAQSFRAAGTAGAAGGDTAAADPEPVVGAA